MSNQSVRRIKQGGEIATVLAIVSMVFIGIGVLVGSRITENAGAPVSTSSEAQALSPSPASPTPIDGGTKNIWFEASTGGRCLAWFTCVGDPTVKKLLLKSKATGRIITELGIDKNGQSPLDLVIGPTCESRLKGLQVNFDPRNQLIRYNRAFIAKYNIESGDVVLSVRTNTRTEASSYDGSNVHHFVYPRPAGLGSEDVEVYFEYDAKFQGNVLRYSQSAYALSGCVPATPTPTTSVTPTTSITTTITPSVTSTPSPTATPTPPEFASCFETCQEDRQCQGSTPKGPLRCVRFGDGFIEPTSAPIGIGRGGTGTFGRGGIPSTPLTTCNPARGDICRCIPSKCRSIEECDSFEKACVPPGNVTPTTSTTPTVTVTVTTTITPTQLTPSPSISITPTISTSPTPPTSVTPSLSPSPSVTPPLSCSFQAIAYVQECDQWVDRERGICARDRNNNYIGKPIKDAAFLSRPGNEPHELDRNFWKVTNNKGAQGSLTYMNTLANLISEGYNTNSNRSLTLNKYLTRDMLFVPSGLNERETNEQLISLQDPASPPSNSKYRENESASVVVDIDGNRYQFLPTTDGGREIRECSNSQLKLRGKEACNMDEFELGLSDASKKDTIAGLNVRCGQQVEYGWTLQKCENQPLDMMFIVDTSLTTKDFGDTIEREKEALREFVERIVTEQNVARVGIVQFNNTSQTILNLTDKNNTREIFAAIDRLTNNEGTRIDLGLEEGYRALSRRVNRNNKRVIVLMSDGRANPLESNRNVNTSCSGTQHQADGCREEILQNATQLKQLFSELEADLITIKFGTFIDTPFDSYAVPPAGLGEQYLMQKLASTYTDANGVTAPLYFDSSVDRDPYAVLASAYDRFKVKLNSCTLAQANFAGAARSADVDGNGVINTTDLYLVYDNYFAEGQDLQGDVNKDGRIDALDPTLVITQIGTSLPEIEPQSEQSEVPATETQ